MADLLKSGDEGAEVQAIQQNLIKFGYDLGKGKDDGIFGPSTEAAVKQAQKENGITVDGIVGPGTRAALAQQSQDEQILQDGAENDAVRAAQEILAKHGFDIGTVDGIFGPKTEAAVKILQEKHGLTADGIVGPKTWRALKSL